MIQVEDITNILIENQEKTILLIFSASWCGPCKRLKAKLKDESDPKVEQIKNLKYVIIDVDDDENYELCQHFKVGGIPHQVFIALENNQLVIKKNIVGYNFDELVSTYLNIIKE